MRNLKVITLLYFLVSILAPCFATDDETGVPKIVINPKGHSGKIFSLNYTPDGEKIISVSEDKSIKIWDAETGELLDNFYCQIGEGPQGMLYSSAISPDGRYLVVGGYPVEGLEDNYIILIDLTTKQQVALGVGHKNVINSLDFSFDSNYLSSASDDGTVILWKVDGRNALIRISTLSFESRVSSVSFSPKNMNLAIATDQRDIRLYNVHNPSPSKINYPHIDLSQHKGNVKLVKYSPDGRFLASADDDNTVVLWNSNGEMIKKLEDFEDEVNSISFSNDGKVMVLLNDISGNGSSYSIPECNKFTDFYGHNNSVLASDFSPKSIEGNYQVASSGGGSNEILVWNAINGKQLRSIKGKGNTIQGLKFEGNDQLYLSQALPDSKSDKAVVFNLFSHQIEELNASSASFEESGKTKDIFQKDIYQLDISGGGTIVNNPLIDGRALVFKKLNNGQVVVGSDFSLKIYDENAHVLKELIGHTGSIRAIAVSENGQFIATGSEDQTINIWDVNATGIVPSLWEVYSDEVYHEFLEAYGLDSIAKVTKRAAWVEIIDFLKDNREKVYKDIEASLLELGEQVQPVATLFVSEDNEWICFTPEGYFACSSAGGQYFVWEVNQGFDKLAEYYNADQYFDILYRPDIVKESLKTGKRATEILREKGERVFDLTKLNRPSAGLFDRPLSADGQTRGLELKRRKYTTKNASIKLTLDVYDGGGGVKEVNIYQNNKLIIVDDSIRLFNDDKVTRQYDVGLVNGVNDFKAVVVNYQNIESRPDHVLVDYVGELIATSDLYILSIGINHYKNSQYNLNYAQPDARAFTEKISGRSKKMFKEVYIHELYDENAVKDEILNKVDEIVAKAKPQDVFVLYYAGHGSLDTEDPDAEYYLIPHDVTKLYGDSQLLDEKGISASELKSLLGKINCQKQLILLDACHSGGAVKTLLTRAAASEEKAIFQLARSAGVVLIAASGTQQYATEFDVLKHGVFTYALLEALDGKGEIGLDERVTVNELKAYMEDRVPELSLEYGGKAQYPTGFSNGQDFPISLLVD